jgi:hypothetical protein
MPSGLWLCLGVMKRSSKESPSPSSVIVVDAVSASASRQRGGKWWMISGQSSRHGGLYARRQAVERQGRSCRFVPYGKDA